MSDIVYPTGCKPIEEDMGSDELIRRLKVLSHTLQTMSQDDEQSQEFTNLALHLGSECFLTHQSKDVQLLIACCIADILRVFAPEAPYKDQNQITKIFMFIIKQLEGLKDPKDPTFKRYFYLLENLAYVKSFNMCFDLNNCQDIFKTLFSLMFRIVSDDHSHKVKGFMLDLLCPIVTDSDMLSPGMLDIILTNIVEPNKTQRKPAYELASQLVAKTSETLREYIQAMFNQIILTGTVEKNVTIAPKIYDLIYELHQICPDLLICVLPQLECKLKSNHLGDRLKVVSLLARMFSEKNSQLAKHNSNLWKHFLGRFCDISAQIRIKCVQSTMHFLLNQEHLRKDIIDALKARQHDADEGVRYEVVIAIVETVKRNLKVVAESDDLLFCVKERTLDKKFKIRKEAMNGLAMIYKRFVMTPEELPTNKSIDWIKNKILHGYYMSGIEDHLLVERLLITCLVPYSLPAEERMKKLYQLLGTIDENATKAFIELQKNQLKVRKMVSDWVKLHKVPNPAANVQKDIQTKLTMISKQLPEPIKAQEFLLRFSNHLKKDATLLKEMETILNPEVTCKECADTMAMVLKKLGQPIMTNLYYNTVKMLLERIASVMVDKTAIENLISLIEECIQNAPVVEEIGISADIAGERGLNLLTVLCYVFSAHFQHENILQHMIAMLQIDEDYVATHILKAFTHLGRFQPLDKSFTSVLESLAPICKELAICGTPKQAKHAIRCVFVNSKSGDETHPIFDEIVESLKETLSPENQNYRTAIVCLGHVAYNIPNRFQGQIKNLIARKIVKELLVKDATEDRGVLATSDWCDEEDLPEETRCKVEGLKTMARWLLGLRSDVQSAQKTFRMLHAFVKHKGDLLQQGNLSPAEMSWLRLSAGKAMLKICEQKGVGDQFTAEQFYCLSQLMIDPVPKVREIFAKKLHKGLSKGIPHKCLPLDFMGYYALGGRETDKRLTAMIKSYIETDVNRRREYIKTFATAEKAISQLPQILPDYMLVFAVPVLTNDPNYTDPEYHQQLKAIEKCLWLILEPMIANKEFFSFGFYNKIIQNMKNHKCAANPDDDNLNRKMWAVCDIAFHLIYSKSPAHDMREYPSDTRIPSMYFAPPTDGFENTHYYLPVDLYGSQRVARPIVVKANRKISLPNTFNRVEQEIKSENDGNKQNDDEDGLETDDDDDSSTETEQPPNKRKRC